jgi:hypothetical protein
MPTDPTKGPTKPRLNGPIHTVCYILRNVIASAAESEAGALFLNGQEATPLRNTLIELGHPQPLTPLQTDNTTAAGFANDTIKQKRYKAMDIRFDWIKCQVRQNHFRVHWRPGSDNLADYHTKHHSPTHHRRMRPTYLLPEPTQMPKKLNALRGCVKSRAQVHAHHARLHTTSYKPEHPESSNNNIQQSKLLNLIHQATALLM